jgi:hypothetical protein
MLIYFIPLFLWFINLEINPSIGGIWLRPDSTGNKRFVIKNIIKLSVHPLKNNMLWTMKAWDLNIFIFYLISIMFYLFFYNLFCLLPEKVDENWKQFVIKLNHY